MSNVRIADLKAHLSEHLRSVRQGARITVLDREKPVALISPYEDRARVAARPPRRPLHSAKLPAKRIGSVDPVVLLLEERRKGRR